MPNEYINYLDGLGDKVMSPHQGKWDIEFVSTRPWTRIIKLEKDPDLGRQGDRELELSKKKEL